MITLTRLGQGRSRFLFGLGAGLALLGMAAPACAQRDHQAPQIDSDLTPPAGAMAPAAAPPPPATVYSRPQGATPAPEAPRYGEGPGAENTPPPDICGRPRPSQAGYQSDDLIGAATGVFGSGAHGLADVIRSILRKQGTPDGYIAGREAGGAFAIGLRYGSGTLCQPAQAALPVYWTGPSIGFDAGASAAKTFVLVYNLNNRDDLFHRFGAGEGQAYLIGGFNVSYLRRGNVVLIPVRLGVGLRLGINGGYMKMSRHQNWFPL